MQHVAQYGLPVRNGGDEMNELFKNICNEDMVLPNFQDAIELLTNSESTEQGLHILRGQFIENGGADLVVKIELMQRPPFGMTLLPTKEGVARLPYYSEDSKGNPEYCLEFADILDYKNIVAVLEKFSDLLHVAKKELQ